VDNVLHVEADVLADPPNWDNVATDMQDWFGQEWLNMLPVGYVLEEIVVTDENYTGSTFGQGVASINLPGVRATSDVLLDPALCAVASWKTNTAKRYARGHTFLPPAISHSELGGTATWSNIGAYWQACLAFSAKYAVAHNAGSTTYVPIVYSHTRAKLGLTPFTFPIRGHSLSEKQHWLRSRSSAP
jgi:hypothetical protein